MGDILIVRVYSRIPFLYYSSGVKLNTTILLSLEGIAGENLSRVLSKMSSDSEVIDLYFNVPFDSVLLGLKQVLYKEISSVADSKTFSLYWSTLGGYFVKGWGWNFERQDEVSGGGWVYGEILKGILEGSGGKTKELHEVRRGEGVWGVCESKRLTLL